MRKPFTACARFGAGRPARHSAPALVATALLVLGPGPGQADPAERMVPAAEMAKFAPAAAFRMARPLPAPAVRPDGGVHDFRITEEADPEQSPFVIRCDLAAADPADTTRPAEVPGVALDALDRAAGGRFCTMAHRAYRTHPRSAFNLGRVEMAEGRIEPAVALFSTAAAAAHPLAALTVAEIYEGQVLPGYSAADAVPFYEIAAEAGVVEAQMALGGLLSTGTAGLEPDPARATRWFRKAARAGNTEAAFELGWAFENGLGAPRDPITAVRWYRSAIAAGNTDALNNLGYLYANGTGVPRDEARAVDLYREAAELGVPAAMSNLGWMLENGIGTGQNVYEAIRWYEQAAALGEPQAMLNLGWLYLAGFDIPADANAALDWFKRAYASGRAEALSYIGEVYETNRALRDPAQAARYYVQALQAGDGWPARRAPGEWSDAMAREMQNALFEAGVYQGPFDAVMGPATRAAMDLLLAQSQVGSSG